MLILEWKERYIKIKRAAYELVRDKTKCRETYQTNYTWEKIWEGVWGDIFNKEILCIRSQAVHKKKVSSEISSVL